jgi:putative transposase
VIRVDNGPEFAGRALDAWVHHQGARPQLIVPGKPMQNAFRVLTDGCEKNA